MPDFLAIAADAGFLELILPVSTRRLCGRCVIATQRRLKARISAPIPIAIATLPSLDDWEVKHRYSMKNYWGMIWRFSGGIISAEADSLDEEVGMKVKMPC